MCSPQLAMMGVSVASSGMQIQAQRQQAKYEMQAASQAAINDYIQLGELQRQQSEEHNVEVSERIAQSMRERSRAVVAMGESGVTGVSPLREIAASYMLAQKDTGIMGVNYANKTKQTNAGIYNTYANHASRVNQASGKMGSFWGTALQIGSAAYGGYSQGELWAQQTGWKPKAKTPATAPAETFYDPMAGRSYVNGRAIE